MGMRKRTTSEDVAEPPGLSQTMRRRSPRASGGVVRLRTNPKRAELRGSHRQAINEPQLTCLSDGGERCASANATQPQPARLDWFHLACA